MLVASHGSENTVTVFVTLYLYIDRNTQFSTMIGVMQKNPIK